MQKSETTWQSGVKWGAIIAFSGFLWICLEFILGYHSTKIEQHPVITSFYYLVMIGLVIWHCKSLGMPILQRNRFIQFLLLSFITAFVSAILSVIGMYIFFNYINPSFFETFQREAINHYVSEGKTLEEATVGAKGYFNENSYYLQGFIGTLFFIPILYTITWIFRRVLFLKGVKKQ